MTTLYDTSTEHYATTMTPVGAQITIQELGR